MDSFKTPRDIVLYTPQGQKIRTFRYADHEDEGYGYSLHFRKGFKNLKKHIDRETWRMHDVEAVVHRRYTKPIKSAECCLIIGIILAVFAGLLFFVIGGIIVAIIVMIIILPQCTTHKNKTERELRMVFRKYPQINPHFKGDRFVPVHMQTGHMGGGGAAVAAVPMQQTVMMVPQQQQQQQGMVMMQGGGQVAGQVMMMPQQGQVMMQGGQQVVMMAPQGQQMMMVPQQQMMMPQGQVVMVQQPPQ